MDDGNDVPMTDEAVRRARRLGHVIRAEREKAGLTQADFGSRLPDAVPQTTVSRWENGMVLMKLERLRSIEIVLGLTAGYLAAKAGFSEVTHLDLVDDALGSYIFTTLDEAIESVRAAETLCLGVRLCSRWVPEPDGSEALEWIVEVGAEAPHVA